MSPPADATRYRWKDMAQDHPLDRLDRRRIPGVNAMLSEMFLHQGCHVSTHAHENEQFAFVVSGRLRFGIGEEGSAGRYEVVVGGGEVLHLPPNLPHGADAEEDTRVIDIFSPPSETTGVDRE